MESISMYLISLNCSNLCHNSWLYRKSEWSVFFLIAVESTLINVLRLEWYRDKFKRKLFERESREHCSNIQGCAPHCSLFLDGFSIVPLAHRKRHLHPFCSIWREARNVCNFPFRFFLQLNGMRHGRNEHLSFACAWLIRGDVSWRVHKFRMTKENIAIDSE